MLPECNKKNCKKPGEYCMGRVKISLDDDWENPFYLCEKHAKEFVKKYS